MKSEPADCWSVELELTDDGDTARSTVGLFLNLQRFGPDEDPRTMTMLTRALFNVVLMASAVRDDIPATTDFRRLLARACASYEAAFGFEVGPPGTVEWRTGKVDGVLEVTYCVWLVGGKPIGHAAFFGDRHWWTSLLCSASPEIHSGRILPSFDHTKGRYQFTLSGLFSAADG